MNKTTTLELLSMIREAADRIRGSVYLSPCPYSGELSASTGQQVYLKLENLQMTGAYKERGALNKILLLSPEEKKRGVIRASAGNHAQAVAYHATRRGIRSTIVMPTTTPLVKVAATQNYGGNVILYGANYDEACQHALKLAREQGQVFLHAFDDIAVIAGQGTIGLELLEQCPQLEAVVVPVGGGGLIAGVACAIKELRPEVKIIGVQTAPLAFHAAGYQAASHRDPSPRLPPLPTASPSAAPARSPFRWSRNMSTRSLPSRKKRSPAPSSPCWNAKKRSPKAPAPRASRPYCSTRLR